MIPYAIVRQYFPDASKAEADWILMAKTGFPAFWEAGDPIETQLRRQLARFWAATQIGFDVTYCCGEMVSDYDGMICARCEAKIEAKERNRIWLETVGARRR